MTEPEPVEIEVEELEEVVVEPDLPVEQEAPADHAPGPYDEYLERVKAMPADEPRYLAGQRGPRLLMGAYTLQPGDVVPGAHHWKTRETYERLGRLVKEPDDAADA